MIECTNCGREFEPQQSYHKVCGRCYWEWRRGTGFATCAECGAEFPQKRPEHRLCYRCWKDQRSPFPLTERWLQGTRDPVYWLFLVIVAVVGWIVGLLAGWW